MKHNWEYKRFSSIADILYGCPFESSRFNVDAKGMPLIRIRDVKPGCTSTFYDGEYSKEYLVKKGELLVGMDGEFNIAAWKSEEALLNQRVCRIKSKNESRILTKYFFYFLGIELKRIEEQTSFVTVKHLSAKVLNNISTPIPPKEVQAQIVAELDKINELIEAKREQLKQLDSLAQSIFYDTFGDPVTNPQSWNVSTLEHVSSILRDGPFGSNLKSDYYRDSGTRVIRLQNIGVGYFSDNDKAYIDEDYYWKISKYTCYPGDIVIGTMGNPNLRACIVPNFIDKAIHKADCIRCVPKDGIANSVFISSMLNTRSILNIASKDIHGATRARISSGQLKQLKIIVPPLSLQQQFAAQIEAIEAQKATVEKSIAELQTLLDSRMDYWFN